MKTKTIKDQSIKLKYEKLIQSETQLIKKKMSCDWQLKEQSNDVEWAKQLYQYLKTSCKRKEIQEQTLKYFSEFYWTKYRGDQTNSQTQVKFQRFYTDDISATSITNPNILKSSMKTQNELEKNLRFSMQLLEDDVNDSQDLKNQRQVLKSYKDLQSDETGQEALCLSRKFNECAQVIKRHLEDPENPLYKIIIKFDQLFYQQYNELIQTSFDKINNNQAPIFKAAPIVQQVQSFVKTIFLTLLKFYRIELKPQDLKKDLLINLVTTMVMQNQTYSIIMNAILFENVHRIKKIQQNMTRFKHRVNLQKLGVNKYFQFSPSFKKLVQTDENQHIDIKNENESIQMNIDQLVEENNQNHINGIGNFEKRSLTIDKRVKRSSTKEANRPFEKTIEAFKEIPKLNSPMKKLEFIYQVFNSLMVSEIDEFWTDVQIDSKKLQVDYENLNGIAIYVALKAAIPILIIDIIFIENFVSQAVLFTNRAYQMTVLHSALSFIEDNMPSYCESKEKTNPLKENMTPQFEETGSLLFQNPRSQGQESEIMSRLLDNGGENISDKKEQGSKEKTYQKSVLEEEMLFELEQEMLNISLERYNIAQRQFSTRLKESPIQLVLQSLQQQQLFTQQNDDMHFDDNLMLAEQNNINKAKTSIHVDAARTIHMMVNHKLHMNSVKKSDSVYNESESNNNNKNNSKNNEEFSHITHSPSSQLLKNFNIYSENEKLLDDYYYSIQQIRDNHLDEQKEFKHHRVTAKWNNNQNKDALINEINNLKDKQVDIRQNSLNKSIDMTKSQITL
ncbi:UNKNOWN [Stylonychia lemnae]|uniref:VPS9 domain-containing protein n=1 Tax=Stylonychia lemnae TaxID=5949 RepID=A0A078AM49_STYLE|nr:UNKNOWN [Stylonychia lemnae]|eukprot:CDW81903.1 UNKNOWN [Stylonychia lemnae]